MNPLLLILFPLFAGCRAASDSPNWNYANFDSWVGFCNRGVMQSPIDIETSDVLVTYSEPITFINYDSRGSATYKKTKRSLEVEISQGCHYGVTAGGLRGHYELHHIHFHLYSEHTIDGAKMPMEAHFVHYDVKYKNLTEAIKHPRGLAVIGVLFHKASEEASNIHLLWNGLTMPVSNPSTLEPGRFLPKDRDEFYRYEGSLTTPPCSEVVVWTVMKETLPISQKQIGILRDFLGVEGGSTNNRPVQDLNDRRVELVITDVLSNSRAQTPAGALIALSLIALLFRN